MRVEITFAGDAAGGKEASRQIVDALKKVFAVSEETGHALSQVKITSGQATETAANARRMQDSVAGVGREARQTTRDLERMRIAGLGGLAAPAASFRNLRTLGIASLLGFGAATSGPGGAAAGAGLAALPGLAATGGAAIGVLAAAFGGLGKAISGDRQEFEKLTPVAQEMVQTLRSLQPWLKSVQETAREGLFPGVEAGLHSALSPANAKAIEDATRGIARALGDVADELGKSLGSPAFTQGFSELMQHSAEWVRELGDAADHLGGALGKVTVAALPLDDWMVSSIQHGAKLLDNWIAQKQATGELAHALDSMKGELQIVGNFAGALGGAVISLSRALEPLGNELLVYLTEQLQHLADWIDRNRQGINDFTTGALHALEDVLASVGPLLLSMAGGLDKVAHAVGGWDNAFEIVIAGVLANALLGVAGKLDMVGGAATGATGEVALLNRQLLALRQFGGMVIGVELIIHSKQIGDKLNDLTGGGFDWNKGLLTQSGGLLSSDSPLGRLLHAAGIGGGGGSSSGAAGSPANPSYPLSLGAHSLMKNAVIGTPYSGTHGKAFNVAGGSDNWESENAVDISAKVGTKVLAVEDGVIGPATEFGALSSLNPRMAGLRLHLLGDSGTEYYYAHLSAITVKPGQRVKKGDQVGLSGSANGVAHLHFAQSSGSPMTTIGSGSQINPAFTPGAASTTLPGKSPFTTPPAFTGDKGANILPESIRAAMALATTTGGAGDNLKATREAVAWLRSNLGSFKGEDLINAYNELGGLLQQVNTLRHLIAGPAPKKGPALASRAGGISAQAYARGLLGQLGGDLTSATPLGKATADTQAAMAAALANLDHIASVYRPRVEKIQAEISKGLATKTLTAADLATLRARMESYGTTISTAVSRAKDAVAAQQGAFQDVWSRMASAAVDAFNAESAKFMPPSQLLLNQLNDARSKQDMADALDAANKQMADALNSVDNSQILDAVRSTVGRYALANAVDAIQSTVLGGSHVDQGVGLLSELQRQLVAQTVPDAEAVKAAQRAIDDAQFQIRAAGLADQAQQEQSAHDQMRESQLAVLNAMAGDWAAYYNQVGGNISAIKALWVDLLKTLDPAAAAAVDSGVTDVGQPTTAIPSSIIPSAAAVVAQAAAAKGKALTTAQINLIRVLKLEPNLHAAGGIYTTPTFRTPFDVVGDRGREAAIPLDTAAGRQALREAAGGGVSTIGDIHVYIGGEKIAEHVDYRIDRATPRISRNLGQRTASRLKSNTFGGR